MVKEVAFWAAGDSFGLLCARPRLKRGRFLPHWIQFYSTRISPQDSSPMPRRPLWRRVRQTSDSKPLLFARVAAGLPLLFYGGLHLIQPTGYLALLHATGILPEEVMIVVIPLMEMVAGILVLVGVWARVGALLAVLVMIPALHTSLMLPAGGSPGVDSTVIAQAPPLWVPLMVLACALAVLVKGAGAFSADFRRTRPEKEEVVESAGESSIP